MKIFLLSLLFASQLYGYESVDPLSPVIIVPGIAGTGLFGAFNHSKIPECGTDPVTEALHRLWLNPSELLPPAQHQLCWTAKMRLEPPQCVGDEEVYWDVPSGCPLVESGPESLYKDRNGTTIIAEGFPGTKGFEYLDYFKGVGVLGSGYFNKFVDAFDAAGYKRGADLFGFPYDWRLPFWQMDFDALKKLIEHAKAQNGDRKVVLISHSMGSLILSYFLNSKVDKAWKDQHIENFVSISGAFGGSSVVIEGLLSGNNNFFNFKLFKSLAFQLIPDDVLKHFFRSTGSFFGLVPNPQVYGLNVRLVAQFPSFEDVLPQPSYSPDGAPVVAAADLQPTHTTHPTQQEPLYDLYGTAIAETHAEDLVTVYTATNWSMLLPPRERALVHQAHEYQNIALQDPEVPVYCFWSSSDSPNTDFSFAYNTDSSLLYTGASKGDGSLNLRSLRWCTFWDSTTFTHEFNNVNHVEGLQSPAVIDMIVSLITGQ